MPEPPAGKLLVGGGGGGGGGGVGEGKGGGRRSRVFSYANDKVFREKTEFETKR